jgi:hypothetical protein
VPTPPDALASSPPRDLREVFATLLLAVAAVAVAWASYQATRWNGEQAKAASHTNALRIEAARAAALAESQTQIDVATFIGWVDAEGTHDDDLATFYRQRFRPEFTPAFEAWLATQPLANPAAPGTPFVMSQYQPAARTQAQDLDRQGESSAVVVNRNIQRAGDYMLGVTLFAVALFFGGMSTKLHGARLRTITLGVGCAVFLGAAAWVVTMPKIVSV